MRKINFTDKNGTFTITNPENYSGLYLPLAGEEGLKSSITPTLGGDSKTDQNHFLLEPVSIENLHNNRGTRNFWCRVEGKGYWSACGVSAEQEFDKYTDRQDESTLEAGMMWQKLTRTSKKYDLQSEITSFVSIDGTTEIQLIKITNLSEEEQEVTPIVAIPVYGRSADNIRDHRHVTSLLHRIDTKECGVEVTPVLSFDERGHQKNDTTYFVCLRVYTWLLFVAWALCFVCLICSGTGCFFSKRRPPRVWSGGSVARRMVLGAGGRVDGPGLGSRIFFALFQ